MSAATADEKMIKGHPGKEFFRFAGPAVLGLIAIASAGIIDGIFVGKFVGAHALAALSLINPMFSLFFGVVVMLTVGAAVMAGKFIGEKRPRDASNIFVKAMICVLTFASFFAALLIVFTPLAARALGADAQTAEMVETYIYTVAWFLPGLGLAAAFSHFLRVDGRPNFSLSGMVLITISNILLDTWMIGYLDWGVWGAAFATGLSAQIGLLFMLTHFMHKQAKLRFARPTGSWREMYTAAYNGLSEFINESSGGIIVFMFNWILISEIGADGVAAFTIVNYLFFTGIMVFYGVSEGLGPLVSVNFGARKPRRIYQFFSLAVGTNFGVGLVLVCLLVFQPTLLAGAFLGKESESTVLLTIEIISVIWPVFLFNGVNIAFSGYFTGMHCAAQSAMIAMSRSLVLPLILIFALWFLTGPMSVFYALPVAEALTLAISVSLFMKKKPQLVLWQNRAKARSSV